MEELLKQWPGARCDRFAICPNCHKPSFSWELLLQSTSRRSRTVMCPLCHDRIDMNLVSPTQFASRRQERSRSSAAMGRSSTYLSGTSHLSEKQLLSVAKKLGAEWQRLAIHMDFSQADVYKFKCDHPHNTEQQILAMLIRWRDRQGSSATTEELQRVLRDAGVDHDAISCLDETDISMDLDDETDDVFTQ
ncbi:CRADD [Branchiostoma lanceolatum]|uniref:CRADD protein n=1 Tax=Branchiostoma lanceolatum TaxID=7740 RepID=A0A8K0EAY5_BRALA|nr:CRADD [Branchiostoma lanceolatum]